MGERMPGDDGRHEKGDQNRPKQCGKCGGTGKVSGKDCAQCNGSGVIYSG